jgi:uncharacterized protein (DUF952 family)
MDPTIFHIVPARDWERAADPFAPASLETEGFIHFSAHDQVARTAAALFAGRSDLLLLEIDPSRIEAPVRWEDTYGQGEEFPHLYGPLPHIAVIDVRPYLPDGSGRFPDPWEPRSSP